MNLTQKRYTVEKVRAIYGTKLTALDKECTSIAKLGIQDATYLAATSVKTIQINILNGLIRPIAKPKGGLLEHFFEVDKYKKALVKRLKIKLGTEPKCNYRRLELVNSLGVGHYIYVSTVFTRVVEAHKMLQAQLNVLCDELMLGTVEEAKSAITKAHAVKL